MSHVTITPYDAIS